MTDGCEDEVRVAVGGVILLMVVIISVDEPIAANSDDGALEVLLIADDEANIALGLLLQPPAILIRGT